MNTQIQKCALIKESHHWPKQCDVPDFFGHFQLGPDGHPTAQWENCHLTQIQLPYPMRLSWQLDVTVVRMTCHKLVAYDLKAILTEILAHYGDLKSVQAARMDLYGGCYHYRTIHSSARLSMHSWGIAIDMDPDGNPLQPKRPDDPKPKMPSKVVEIFKRHGWAWGGDWTSPYDPQHFQATAPL